MDIEHVFQDFGLNAEAADELKDHFTLQAYRPGDTVFNQGERSDSFFRIVSGELVVILNKDDGTGKVLDVMGPGLFFGEIGLLQKIPRTATIRALTHVQVQRLEEAEFFDLLETSAPFAEFLDKLSQERLLTRIPDFSALHPQDLGRLREVLRREPVPAGRRLCRQGWEADKLFILTAGKARIARQESDGREMQMGERNPGEYYGDEAFFAGTKYNADWIMEEDGEVLVLERKDVLKLVRRHPSIAAALPMPQGLFAGLLPFFYDKAAYAAIPTLSMNRPKLVLWIMLTVLFAGLLLTVPPSIFPDKLPFLHGLKVDTDPENMLSAEDPARVLHNRLKEEMNLHDLMVVGVVNDTHPEGIYNPDSLARIHELAEFAKKQHWERDGEYAGVREVDIMAPSTVDDISQAGPGVVSFSWLMPKPPATQAEALEIRDTIKRLPLMNSTLASADNQAIALYLPLTSKDVSYRVYHALRDKIDTFEGDEKYYITGLPVAEDNFGVEMFIQMAVSAPAAMAVIFLLMYLFFRNLTLIIAPMVVAMVSVMIIMALLVISGQTVHIMSSMIPIFIMPIAVLDSVHILSEFFDYYPRLKSRRLTMEHVMRELFVPMLYTSVTTAVGFASLALLPIPPVQVFGIFVAIGVLLAWLLSISFIPAYIFLVERERIEALANQSPSPLMGESRDGGDRQAATSIRPLSPTLPHPSPEQSRREGGSTSGVSLINRALQGVRWLVLKLAIPVLVLSVVLVGGFIYGILQIQVNDNPVRWFHEDHDISIADRALNEHFAGTYMAYLAFKPMDDDGAAFLKTWREQVDTLRQEYPEADELADALANFGSLSASQGELLAQLENFLENALDAGAISEADESLAEDALDALDRLKQDYQQFKNPALLNYLADLQAALPQTGIVGKSVSLTDFVKTVNRELHGGEEDQYRVPDTAPGVAQTLLAYQNSHRPQDLWRFVTTDFRQGIVWLMLNSGDNIDMTAVVEATEKFMHANPPPVELKINWFGLNYINVVWQEKMVSGMLFSILGSYLAVLFIMIILLRSLWWGMLAMIPLTSTLLVIYGALGLMGKSYDMPVAVLSALTIGLAVDFAIHFLVRIRHLHSQTGDWQQALLRFYDEPAQAILRNLLVVAIGFLPLLLAPLVPYNTVGNLIATILLTSGIATLIVIPALLKTASKPLFPKLDRRRTTVFNCRDAVVAGAVAAALGVTGLESVYPLSAVNWPGYALLLAVIAVLAWYKCRELRQVAETR